MKERLDVLLLQQGYADSREKAKRIIMTGVVFVDGQRVDKAGTAISSDAVIEVKGAACPYVSRGGLKLEKALEYFQISLANKICLDIGASTGGFTDCLLQNGGEKVYAVDVGYGQLDWKLRNDSRVVNLEKINFRYFDESLLKDDISFVTADVSFISLSLILPVIQQILQEGELVCLVKPQFEAGREQVGKKGIVREKNVHKEVLVKITDLAEELGFQVKGMTFSPMTGAKGNVEYLLYAEKSFGNQKMTEKNFEEIIDHVIIEAHEHLVR